MWQDRFLLSQHSFLASASRFLIHPRVVLVEILSLVGLLILSAVVPQAVEGKAAVLAALHASHPFLYRLIDALDLVRIRTSPLFLTNLGLIVTSLAVSVYLQAARLLRRHVFAADPADDSRRPQQNRSRPSRRPWGGLLFHLGLLLIALAGFMNYLLLQRGYIQLIEGETFHGTEKEFAVTETGILQSGFSTDYSIRLDSVGVSHWDNGQLRELTSRLTVFQPGGGPGTTATVAINAPLSLADLRVHQSFDHGYTLSLVLKDRAGVAVRSFFLLDSPRQRGQPAKMTTNFPATPYRLQMQFFPDISGRSLQPAAPLLSLKVFRGTTVVFDGLLLPGQGGPLEREGVRIRFEEFSRWSGLILQRQADRLPAYAGFLFCVLGALLLYGGNDKEKVVRGHEQKQADLPAGKSR